MSVVLRPLAVTCLSQKFARDMGNNKIRHYRVPLSLVIIKKLEGKDPVDLVKEHIEKTEGVKDIELEAYSDEEMFDIPGVSFDDEGAAFNTLPVEHVGGITMVDASHVVFDKERKLGRALMKVKSHGQIYQKNYYSNIFLKYRDRFAYRYNQFVVPVVNKMLYKLQGADYCTYNFNVRQIRYMELKYVRDIHLAHFISIAFEASNIKEATEALLADLRILHKNKLIMGNLAMPKLAPLVDPVGANKKYFVLFCFPLVDSRRFLKVTGKSSPIELPTRDTLKMVGVKYETLESEVKWLNDSPPERGYEIEEVYVGDITSDEARQQVIDGYNQALPLVKDIVARNKKDIGTWEKTESRSQNYQNGLFVDVTMRNKETGQEVRVRSDDDKKDS